MPLNAVILAAGKGKRMQSDLPKVLHEVGGRPMVSRVIDTVRTLSPDRIVLVVGYQADLVKETIRDDDVSFALQSEQLGTGHAVMQAQDDLAGASGTVVVLNGDVPGLRPETLRNLVDFHESEGATATVLTARLDDPSGYGRIVRGADGRFERIVEHRDASPEELSIDEINSGMFCFDKDALFEALTSTDRDNAQNEYYLTDVIEVLSSNGASVRAYCVDDSSEVAGVNDAAELESIRKNLDGGGP